MSSPASTADTRPHQTTGKPTFLTFGSRTREDRRFAPTFHMRHFRRPSAKDADHRQTLAFGSAMAHEETQKSPAPASGSLANSTALPSFASIPPRTSSSQGTYALASGVLLRTASHKDSSTAAAAAAAAVTDTSNSPHRRQRSRKTSLGTTTFPPAMSSAPPNPPPDPNRFATEDWFLHSRRPWSDEKDRILTGPYDYLNGNPGKDFRSALVRAFDAWLEVPPESLEIITRVVSMLHTASLLVDDVEDYSQLRRGLPVAHSIFGIPQTINSSNYIYFCALQELLKLKNPKAVSIFTEELLNLHRGQGMDLFWRDTLTCPTEDDYLEMVGNKTGGLFRLGIKLMQAESRSLVDCVPLVNIIGLIFQIADDYHNLFNSQYTANKGMCEDLTEGKFSFPVIHSIRSNPGDMQLLNILRQKTENEEVKRYAVAYMESTGSFEYTRKVLDVLIARARRMADEVDDGRGKAQGVHQILDRMVIKD
ncbi:hypothetical protein VTJ04DRAFT_9969 [Mycothermus thermophilus]|uniref:uncharacterized protein n=1 Tax=Humicola insolens TaxID=85995 RepID=UPI003742F470